MLIEKWIDIGKYKVNEIGATLASGTMVADGMDNSWSLSEWSTVLGIIYLLTMIIPRLCSFYQFLLRKLKKKMK